jgi:hypothetical protein
MALGISRATLPAEFYDVTSKQLLLAPVPQFLHARLIMSAVGQRLNTASMALPVGATRQIPEKSGVGYLSLNEMQYMLSDEIAKEAIQVKEDFSPEASATPGHTIRFNRPKFTDTTYTMASREVPAGGVISTTPINISSDQVPLTVKRWVGPYSSSQSAPAPIGISKFDASRALHSIPAIADLHFQYDFHKTVDAFGVALFDAVDSSNIIYAGSMTGVNDSTVVNDNPFDFTMIMQAEKRLDDLHIPRFRGTGKRIMILTTKQAQDLALDDQFQRLARYEQNFNPLFKTSYVASVGSFDILKSATLTQTANSNSVPIQYGQAFGPGMVGVGPAGMPYVTPSTADNYGEDFLAVWIWYCAFGVLDQRFGVSLRSS